MVEVCGENQHFSLPFSPHFYLVFLLLYILIKKPRFRRSLAKNGLGSPIVLPGDIRTLGWLFTRVQSRMQCFSQNAIFRLNYRKPAALINGQEAQSHSTWSYAKAKASLAFSQCAAD